MLDLHGPEYITEVVLIVVCVCCVYVCSATSYIIHYIHAHNTIHLMMIIHGIQHGGLYFDGAL